MPRLTATRIRLKWPPTVNTYWRTPRQGPLAGRTMISAKGRQYREHVAQSVLEAGFPKFCDQRLRVTIHCHQPDRRKRDLSNLPKGIEDGLEAVGVFDDDEQIDDLRIVRHPPSKPGHVIVEIEAIQPKE